VDARVEDVRMLRVDRTEVLHDADLADAHLRERAEGDDEQEQRGDDADRAQSEIRVIGTRWDASQGHVSSPPRVGRAAPSKQPRMKPGVTRSEERRVGKEVSC